MKKFFSDFKKFVFRGNIVDMAIGIIIGSAFTAIVTALANKILMPIINWILNAIVGGDGLSAVYTFLKKTYVLDELGNPTATIDLANSIYIDWGAFITAIIDFLLIALVLFLIIKAMMKAQDMVKKGVEGRPTKEEKRELKERGVNMKNHKEVATALKELRDSKLPAPAPAKPSQDELLAAILEELKKQNEKADK